MFGFMTSTERNMIRRDYEQLVRSPEACMVTLLYRAYLSETTPDVIDRVYKVNRRVEDSEILELSTRCLQQIITPTNYKSYPQGMILLGDCVFWFSQDVNLEEPIEGKKMVRDSLVIRDPSGLLWESKLHTKEGLQVHLLLREGPYQVGQPIWCSLKK